MSLEFKNNNFYKGIKDIYIRKNEKLLKIFYGGTGDLYFDIFGVRSMKPNDINSTTFYIDKNEEVYPYFEKLINNILSSNIFEWEDIETEFSTSEKREKNIKKENIKELKYKSSYSNLVVNGSINWYSDSIYNEKANILQIKKSGEGILLTFTDNPADPVFGFGIRICNSGSKYEPFNICFMNFFNQLQEVARMHLQTNVLVKAKKPIS